MLPNILALARIPLAIVVCFLVIHEPPHWRWLAAGGVCLAIATDYFDGILARRLGLVSTFGAYLDLTVDKVFVCPLLFLLAGTDPLLLWMAALVCMREFLVMGIRSYAAATKAQVIPAAWLGKVKTFLLFPAVLVLILDLPWIPFPAGEWLLVGGAVAALLSAIDYGRRAWPVLHAGLTGRDRAGDG